MRSKFNLFIAATVAALLLSQPGLGADSPAKFFKRLLKAPKSSPSRTDQATTPRVAQSRSRAMNLPQQTTQDARQVEAEAKRMTATIERKLSSVQHQLSQEEKQLNAQLAGLAKKRQQAIAKGDEQQLKKIESQENAIVKGYEKRVERLLAGATSPSLQAQPRGRARQGRQPAAPPKQQEQKPRRGFRLWPFR